MSDRAAELVALQGRAHGRTSEPESDPTQSLNAGADPVQGAQAGSSTEERLTSAGFRRVRGAWRRPSR